MIAFFGFCLMGNIDFEVWHLLFTVGFGEVSHIFGDVPHLIGVKYVYYQLTGINPRVVACIDLTSLKVTNVARTWPWQVVFVFFWTKCCRV